MKRGHRQICRLLLPALLSLVLYLTGCSEDHATKATREAPAQTADTPTPTQQQAETGAGETTKTTQSTEAAESAKTPSTEIGGDFKLTDHHGQPFALEQLRGKLVLIFFGYTYCPDICPTEMATIVKVLRALKTEADKLQPLFISIDPERDTPEKLSQYIPFYSPALIGLTGTPAEVDVVARAYRVQYKIGEHKAGETNYLVDHSANLYLLNGQGKLSQIIPFGLPLEHILQVIKEELKQLASPA